MSSEPSGQPVPASVPVPVSAAMRAAKSQAEFLHHTVGQVQQGADGRVTLACSCGTTLTNGPGWSIDEHIRLHRAEARFLALVRAADPGVPRLVDEEPGAGADPVLAAQVDAVRRLHHPAATADEAAACAHCGTPWPCATRAAMDAAARR